MKFSRIIFIIVLAFLPITLSLGQVLKITEFGTDGNKDTLNFHESLFPIVDINSRLHIHIDKDAVRTSAASFNLFDQSYDLEQLNSITAILKNETELLEIIGTATGTFEQRKEKLKQFSAAMTKLIKFILKQKNLRAQANAIYGAGYETNKTYSLLFGLVRDEIKNIGQEIDKAIKEQRIYFRLGGWLRKENGTLEPVHIPQFDSYEDGKFYEFPRFMMPAPEELQKQYKAASDAAEEYNKQGTTAFDDIKKQINVFKDSLNLTASCIAGTIQDSLALQQETDEIKTLVKPILNQVDSLVSNMKAVIQILQEIVVAANTKSFDLSGIAQLNVLIEKIRVGISTLPDSINATINQVKAKVHADIADKLNSIVKVAPECLKPLGSYIDNARTFIATIQNWFVLAVPENISANLEFSDKVKSFLMEDIPESTDLDLRNTGQRSEGDEIYIRAALEKEPDTNSGQKKSYELERAAMSMFRVDWYSELSAGAVFLDPFKNSATKLTKQFQAAPSYNLLFKWGSRSSYAYNKFWRVGIGLNVSAPDFDLDSVPEIGLGITVTTALDYLQLGLGRNLGVDTWYWFFGLRLPVGTITLTENQSNQ